MKITYRKLNENHLDVFIKMRIDHYLRHLSDGTFISWLAMDEDRIIGTSGISIVEKPPYFGCPSGKIGLLSSMFTDKVYRRKGIAKALLSKVVDEAKKQGCGTVQITASDMGVLLYSNFGFEKRFYPELTM